jgi:hypothetical protein
MPIPKKIKVGSQFFDVVERTRHKDGMLNDSSYGYTLETENLIVVDVELAPSRKKVTLLHELMHAMIGTFDTSVRPQKNADFQALEHYFIGILEDPLLMLVQDNPDLLDWLTEQEK